MNEIVFLGIFDKIANWIMGGITKALTWLFSNVIAPVFSVVWDSILKYVVDMIREFLALIFYKLYALLLSVVYTIEQMVYSFSGVNNVNIDNQKGNIVDLLMNMPAVNKAFWYITMLSIVLCFIFTIVAVMRSTFDFNFDSRKSVGRVLTQFFTAAVSFLVMPALCYGLIQLTTICMSSLYKATSGNGVTTSITDSLFMMTVKSPIVAQNKPEVVTALAQKLSNTPMFWSSFDNIQGFLKGKGVTFNARDVDLFVGFIGAIVLIWNLISLSGVFIKRVMELIVLYIVSPFFVSTMPLDDGERFVKWRSTFIGRLSMGAGMIIALNIMMMILSVVMNSDTSASVSFVTIRDPNSNIVGYASDIALDTLIKLVFMVGCIASVRSIGVAITGIMDQEAASAMNEGLNMNKEIYGNIKNIKDWADRKRDDHKQREDERRKESLERQKKAAGFKGQEANERELGFQQMLKNKRMENKNKATFMQRGDTRAAYKRKSKEAKKALNDFTNLQTNAEREQFINDFFSKGGMKSLSVDPSKNKVGNIENAKERKAAVNLDRKIAAAKANRGKFEKGSEQWNKYNNQVKDLKAARDKFDSLNSHAEREAFMDTNKDKFSEQAAKTKGEKKALDNLSKRAANAKAVRDSLTKGTDAWNKADKRYNEILEKSAMLESLGTHAERDDLIAAAAGGAADAGDMRFVDRQGGKATGLQGIKAGLQKAMSGNVVEGLKDASDSLMGSNKHQEAQDNINKRIARAVSQRDSSEKGSAQWNKYNAQVEALNADKLKFSYSSPEERDALIADNPSFAKTEGASYDEMQAGKNLNANIKNAEEDRDRYKEGSAKWNAANERVNNLKNLRAQYIDSDTHESRAGIISSNKDAFTNLQSSQRNNMENKYNAWKLREEYAGTPEEKEHAHKMAKSYAGFIEGYDNAQGNAGRASVLKNVSNFESLSANNPSALVFTAKEADAFNEISASRNDNYIMGYMNAKTHEDRTRILDNYNSYKAEHDGARPPVFNMISESEQGYVNDIRSTAQRLTQLASSGNYTPEQRGQMRELAGYYTAAADEYESLPTNEQRYQVVNAVNNHFSSIPKDIATAAGLSAPVAELSMAEQSFAAHLSDEDRRTFSSIPTRRERCAYRDEYYRNSPTFFPMNDEETQFYESHFAEGHDDGYRSTASYRTAFLGATNREERQHAMQQYNDYVMQADDFDLPGNWENTVSSSIESRSSAINSPALHSSTRNFARSIDDEHRREFSNLTSQREQQEYMTAYYMASPDFIDPTEEEENFYNQNFNVPDDQSYRNMPVYRTAFMAATSHEQRQQIMTDYNYYTYSADASHSPGNWSSDDGDAMEYYDLNTIIANADEQMRRADAEPRYVNTSGIQYRGMGSSNYRNIPTEANTDTIGDINETQMRAETLDSIKQELGSKKQENPLKGTANSMTSKESFRRMSNSTIKKRGEHK